MVKIQCSIYNLDIIISIGYRVNSKEATYFKNGKYFKRVYG
ncbi:virulence RhuM family protein [Methanobrevibacter arboriphilus]|nr:virulence RhuM family protein [Methanobrevibacter arboriphilus]